MGVSGNNSCVRGRITFSFLEDVYFCRNCPSCLLMSRIRFDYVRRAFFHTIVNTKKKDKDKIPVCEDIANGTLYNFLFDSIRRAINLRHFSSHSRSHITPNETVQLKTFQFATIMFPWKNPLAVQGGICDPKFYLIFYYFCLPSFFFHFGHLMLNHPVILH